MMSFFHRQKTENKHETATNLAHLKYLNLSEKKEKILLVTPASSYFRGILSVDAIINNSNF